MESFTFVNSAIYIQNKFEIKDCRNEVAGFI
jgi:hypothetical protein